MNVYLVGYMGSGKSTVGKQLARLLGYDFIDIDRQFEEMYRISIPDFFLKYDEDAFRLIERKLLLDTFQLTQHVISTGGGTASYHDNMDLINQNGLSVYIRMHPNSLFVRLKHAKRPRPRIAELNTDDLRLHIDHDLQLRETYYNRAKFQVKGEDINVEDLAARIKAELKDSL